MSSSSPQPPSYPDDGTADESSARLARWKAKWDERSLGWHESHVHEALVKYGDLIIPGWSTVPLGKSTSTEDNRHVSSSLPGNGVCDTGAQAESSSSTSCGRTGNGVRIFFPLCGKTLDMAAVAAHPLVSQVVGVDGIRTALDEFSKEHPDLQIREEEEAMSTLEENKEADGAPRRYDRLVGNKILLLKGDFFGLDETATGGRFDAVFDRASLVAIDPSLRGDYVQVMKHVVRPGGKILLIVIERMSGNEEEDRTAGPPFSVPEAQVRALYETQDWVQSVTLLEEKEPDSDGKRWSVYYLIETVTL